MHPSESDPESDPATDAEPEADDADTDDAATPDTDPAGPQRRRAVPVAAPVVISVVLSVVIAVVATGLLGWRIHQDRQTDHLHEQAVSTARDYLVAMAAFDYEHLDANSDLIAANSTPQFAGQYTEMVSALRDIVVASEGQASATADRIAVEHLDTNTATVIAFVDQQVTNVTAPQGNTQRYRMLVHLVRDGDRWIVDNVETL